MKYSHYDAVIIGAGLSGILLINEILKDRSDRFRNWRFLVVDEKLDDKKDFYISYWDKENCYLNDFALKEWRHLRIADKSIERTVSLEPYRYYTVSFEVLKRDILNHGRSDGRFEFQCDEVIQKDSSSDKVMIKLASGKNFSANLVFDSSFDANCLAGRKTVTLQQRFIGLHIKSKESVFNENHFTMFDFEMQRSFTDQFSFMYVLPVNTEEALIELVSFEDLEFEELIVEYLLEKKQLRPGSYEIIHREAGESLLTNAAFRRISNNRRVLKIGAAGGLIKPSSGYGVTRMLRDSKNIVAHLLRETLKTGFTDRFITSKVPMHGLCDATLLDYLSFRGTSSKNLFMNMISQESIESLFKLLDEEADLKDFIKVSSKIFSIDLLTIMLRRMFLELYCWEELAFGEKASSSGPKIGPEY